MNDVESLDKRAIILDAAFKVFLSYGFRRTTMADIADAAGISRPALYLEFKNKADIYRAGFVDMLDRTFRDVDCALLDNAPICNRLMAALEAGVIRPMRRVAMSPHGEELFEVKQEIAGDLGQDWNDFLERSLARALAAAEKSGDIDFTGHNVDAEDLARLIVSCVEGIRRRKSDWHQAEADICRMVKLLVGAIRR